MIERDSLQKKLINSKYGASWGEWCSSVVRATYGVDLWKHIINGWNKFACFTSVEWVMNQQPICVLFTKPPQ